jgi:hypothetical protein
VECLEFENVVLVMMDVAVVEATIVVVGVDVVVGVVVVYINGLDSIEVDTKQLKKRIEIVLKIK